MSWSASIVTEPGNDWDGKIQELELPEGLVDRDTPHVRGAFLEAKYMAIDLIGSEEFGDPEQFGFTVNLGGHANPNHEPTEGWTNDFVVISIHQRKAE